MGFFYEIVGGFLPRYQGYIVRQITLDYVIYMFRIPTIYPWELPPGNSALLYFVKAERIIHR